MSTAPEEPADHHVYQWVSFNRDTFEFFLAAVYFYQSQLEADLEAVKQDEDLRQFLSDEVLETYPIAKELERVKRVRAWIEAKTEKAGARRPFSYETNIAHETVRFLKSVCRLYLEHMRRKRQAIASRRATSKALLEAMDQQIAHLEEKTQLGVFRSASLYPLVLEQIPFPAADSVTVAPPVDIERRHEVRPSPVILDTIEIRDPDLRARCLDLLAQFSRDGQNERLDTVISEATRILEDRLRSLAAAPSTTVGVNLAQLAFGLPSPRLIVSDVVTEQEGAALLFRGVFAFIRNSVGHRLLGPLQPERVLQLVGMVDYLISVAEAARREIPEPRG